MKFQKKGSATTIAEVIEANTGMSIENFTEIKKDTPIKNLPEMAERIKDLVAKGKKIAVFADYDCDGITSGTIMHLMLSSIGANFSINFPKRSVGYGLLPEYLEIPEMRDADVIITVDNGIAAVEAIVMAKEMGKQVLILDHHLEPEGALPPADIIVDPHVFKYSADDFEDWCAAGLAYRLIKLICKDTLTCYMALQFAAIGTVADVVPLKEDNRKIVKKGLKALENSNSLALKRMVETVANGHVDEDTIGFKIGPIINSLGRIDDDARRVYNYFITGDYDELNKLIETNETRKTLVKEAVDRAYNIINRDCLYGECPMIIYDPETVDGIVGVVAGRLAEEFNVPVICFTDADEGIIKGSARSPSINIKKALDKVSDLLLHYGGHTGAAGLSMKKDDLYELRSRFIDIFSSYEIKDEADVYEYDLEVDGDNVAELMPELEKYAPYGAGNPRPVFLIKNFHLYPKAGAFYKVMGSDESTIKLYGKGCSAIGFGLVSSYNEIGLAKNLNIIGTLSKNYFMYKAEIQISIKMMDKAETTVVKSALASKLADALKDALI